MLLGEIILVTYVFFDRAILLFNVRDVAHRYTELARNNHSYIPMTHQVTKKLVLF